MHVAINAWFWNQTYTGSGQYLRRLTAALRTLQPDMKLTLVMPEAPQADVPDGVSVMQTGAVRGNLGKVWFEQRTFPRAVKRSGADLAFVPYWGPPLSSPVPLVTSVLDVIPLVLPEYAATLKTNLYNALVRTGAAGSSAILTLSEQSKADIIEKLEIPAEKITVTPLAADDRFNPRMGAERDAEVRAKYDLPDRFVLYLGSFDRRKQVNELLLAYTYVAQAEGTEVPLILAGKPPAQWGTPVFPDLPKYASELKLDDAVRWLGAFDEADKPSLYRLATTFVFPSRYEGFGLPILEAMACGTPTIGWDAPAIREVAGDSAFLVTSAREMAGAILASLGEEPLRATLRNQGLAQATRFNWRKTAQTTLSVFEGVLAG